MIKTNIDPTADKWPFYGSIYDDVELKHFFEHLTTGAVVGIDQYVTAALCAENFARKKEGGLGILSQ